MPRPNTAFMSEVEMKATISYCFQELERRLGKQYTAYKVWQMERDTTGTSAQRPAVPELKPMVTGRFSVNLHPAPHIGSQGWGGAFVGPRLSWSAIPDRAELDRYV